MKEESPKIRNELAIELIEDWDEDGDGKLNKNEAEEGIKDEYLSNNFSEIGKFKRAVDMKMAMENGVTENEWMTTGNPFHLLSLNNKF